MLPGPFSKEKQKILKLFKDRLYFLLSCPPLNETTNSKNKTDSSSFRSEGNCLFTTSKNINPWIKEEILELYSTSIAFAPNDSNELALAYGNRSALLFHLKDYEQCLFDLNEALSLPISSSQKLKFMLRKLDCLIALQMPECQTFYEQLKSLLEEVEDIDTNTRSKFSAKLQNAYNILENNKYQDKEEFEDDIADVDIKEIIPNKEAPLFSNKVNIAYNAKYGIHVKAARKITPGEILCEQDIYVIFPKLGFTYTYCSNCYQFTMTSIPCKNCAQAVYCSVECKSNSWKQYHDIECNLIHRIWKQEGELTPHRVLTIMILILALREAGSIEALENIIKDIEDWQGNKIPLNF